MSATTTTAATGAALDGIDSSVGRAVEIWAEREADRTCIVQDDGEQVTYGQLDTRAEAVARGLARLRVERGDRVVTLGANDLEAVYVTIALGKLGAIEVPVNPALVGESLSHVLADAGPKAAVVHTAQRQRLAEALPGGSRPVIVEAGERAEGASPPGGEASLEEMLAEDGSAIRTEVLGCDPAAIMYTSGTTGLPKGALLPHRHTVCFGERTAMALELTGDDTLMTILPLFHAAGKYMNLGACLHMGARCLLIRRFSAGEFWNQAREYGATAFHGVVSMAHFILAQPPAAEDRVHPLTRGLLAPAPKTVIEDFAERFDLVVYEAYGSTEANIPVFNRGGPPGACGVCPPPYRMQIVDEHDRPVPVGEVGEIVVNCDEPWATCSGYWNRPEATIEAFRNFWFHTGDAGYLDDEERLWFVDRIKDIIRRRGENIAARTVEDAVNAIEGVVESGAYAVPSAHGDEEIAVAIVVHPETELEAAAVVAACRRVLPSFAVPSYVRFVDALPKTETGKVKKFELKTHGTEGAVQIGDA